MRLLLDECVVQDFRHLIHGHEVFTVGYQQWSGISNGQLLALAAASGFDCLITTDRGYAKQHNAATLPIAVVIREAASNDLEDLEPLVAPLHAALQSLPARAVVRLHAAEST